MGETEFCFRQEGRLNMIRPSAGRAASLLSTLLLAYFAGACGGGGTTNTNANTSANTAATPASSPANQNAGGAAATGRAKLNLNTATDDEFKAAIPGLGDRMAHEFEEYRPYRSIQQFRKEMEKYVKPEQIAEYEKYVFVPIVPNESDAATLQQIPGLDASEAGALVAGRPYASNDAFIEKLRGSVTDAELTVARTYLNAR
jgi:DNA uptake protein ComE-like DNA-binding protein